VSSRKAPRIEPRRAPEFERELLDRARAWIPSWTTADDEQDFGRALLRVAARFSAEVAARLDDAGDKMKRGFLDWLAVRGEAARPARMPVVFKMADTVLEPVFAPAPVRLQVDAQGASVTFETETDVQLVPGHLDLVVAADPALDAFYLPPPGLSDLSPLDSMPTQWRLKSFASPLAKTLQLDPALGLAEEMLIDIGGSQYLVVAVKDDLVTIEPPLPAGDGLSTGMLVSKVSAFAPFEGARNQQNHLLYLGHDDLLNIEAQASITVVGAQGLGAEATWEYWGKKKSIDPGDDEPRWRELPRAAMRLDALVLTKPAGAVETHTVGSVESRWIRARTAHVDALEPVLSTDTLTLRINATQDSTGSTAGDTGAPDPALLPPIDVIVNTTPQASSEFYPLGREPRMFDTFYLGCPEAFSKHGAKAALHFEFADSTFAALSAINAGPWGGVMAGVDRTGALHMLRIGADGKLSRLSQHAPMRPSLAGDAAAQGTALTLRHVRTPLWFDPGTNDLFAAAVAGKDVWVWREAGSSAVESKWLNFQSPPAVTDPEAPVEGLALIERGGRTVVVALRQGRVSWRAIDDTSWSPQTAEDSLNATIDIAAIAPVIDEAKRRPTGTLLAIDTGNTLYAVPEFGAAKDLMTQVCPDVAPFGLVRTSGIREVLAVAKKHDKLLGWQSSGPNFNAGTSVQQLLDAGDLVAGSRAGTGLPNGQAIIDAHIEGAQLTLYALANSSTDGPVLLAWIAFDTNLRPLVFKTRSDSSIGAPRDSVTLYGSYAYTPSSLGRAVAAAEISGSRFSWATDVSRFKSALGLRNPPVGINPGDLVAFVDPALSGAAAVTTAPLADGLGAFANESYWWLDRRLDRDRTSIEDVLWYQAVEKRKGRTQTAADELELDGLDPITADGDFIVIEVAADTYRVAKATTITVTLPRVATLDISLPATTPAQPIYWTAATPLRARILPSLEIDAGNAWLRDFVRRGDLYFPTAGALRQRVVALAALDSPLPDRLALVSAWPAALPAAGSITFIFDAAVARWIQPLSDDTSNPSLAWEYWNGTGWWALPIDDDTTRHFENSGDVSFKVPADHAATDWAGKTSHWIRARLVGGDYGREKVIVKTTPLPSPPNPAGTTEQVVERSTDGIRAPYALDVWVRYAIDEAVVPTFLLTVDSGTLRNQSDANRTPNARIEVFTPLLATLRRLAAGSAAPQATAGCVPDCACPTGEASTGPQKASAAAAPPPSTSSMARAERRALYVGFDAKLAGAPVKILLLVDAERDHAAHAPIEVDALVGNSFAPITVNDSTRAVGESGILSLAFAVPPTAAELFGKTLTWLRISPAAAGDAQEWKPRLRGAYLNAVWASATETLTRELLGSSEGAPSLTLRLARPPLLRNSLELRVKEPLSDEERAALVAGDPRRVLSEVENLPGDWVLWDRAIDPGDEAATDRVYALDEDAGEVRFGDGKHGAIPPVGRDSIVAFRYQRTEPPPPGGDSVPANAVAGRTPLNLVSSVEGVDVVAAADQAAGGAPPESVERVMRYGTARLRHRSRAVTASDFEDLALQSSPDIVQARSFVHRGQVRLVVVMRGKDPVPNGAQRRELRRLLLAAAPPSLGVAGRLRVEGPVVRRIRVELSLRVVSLDDAGAVTDRARRNIAKLFDTTIGGVDGEGWALGANPNDDDIAFALLDVERLAGIASVAMLELAGADEVLPWKAAVAAHQLVMLADDGIRISFEPAEVAA
jgi:hypothetical protein